MDTVLIGLLGGLITGISPCILPVLPVIFLTAGAQSAGNGQKPEVIEAARSRPYCVIAGLVPSFTLVTLGGSLLLGLLNLPQDAIRWAGIAVLLIIGVGMLIPRFEQLLEKRFQWLPRRKVNEKGNGFGMGLALGTVFVPCAGPVLAAIIVAGATGSIGANTVLLTVSFAIGVALPLLIFALAGRGLLRLRDDHLARAALHGRLRAQYDEPDDRAGGKPRRQPQAHRPVHPRHHRLAQGAAQSHG